MLSTLVSFSEHVISGLLIWVSNLWIDEHTENRGGENVALKTFLDFFKSVLD